MRYCQNCSLCERHCVCDPSTDLVPIDYAIHSCDLCESEKDKKDFADEWEAFCASFGQA